MKECRKRKKEYKEKEYLRLVEAIYMHDIRELERIIIASPNIVHIKNYNKDSCLHIAVVNNNSDAIELLIAYGANINALNKMNQTPLHYAALLRNVNIYMLLMRYDANVSKPDLNGYAAKDILFPDYEEINKALVHLMKSIQDVRQMINSCVDQFVFSRPSFNKIKKNNSQKSSLISGPSKREENHHNPPLPPSPPNLSFDNSFLERYSSSGNSSKFLKYHI